MRSGTLSIGALAALLALTSTARAADFVPNHMFVSNEGDSIFEFAQDGSFVRTIVLTGTPQARGLLFDANGALLVADTGANRITTVAADGTSATAFATSTSPHDLQFGPGGDIYVSILSTNRLRVYTPAGVFLREVGASAGMTSPRSFEIGPDGHVYSESGSGSTLKIFELDPFAPSLRNFGPAAPCQVGFGLCFAPDGGFLIAGGEANLVSHIDKAGVKVNTFGSGSPFLDPRDVVIGPSGNLFIAYQTGTGQGLVGEFGFDNVKLRDIGNGFGVTLASRIAFAPFRFTAKLSGQIKRGSGEAKVLVDEECVISISPNSGTVLVKLTNYPADDLVTVLGRDTLVFHGSDLAKTNGDTKHTFVGADVALDAHAAGFATLALDYVTQFEKGTSLARVKKFTGTLSGTGQNGGFSVKVKSKALVVTP